MTQGLDGLKNYRESKRWTKTFQVKYELHDGDLEYIVGKDGQPFTFDGNYDKYSIVTNTFPYPVLTKRIQILPITWAEKSASLRVEFLGCKAGCISSLGVCQDTIVNGQPPINIVPASAMSASSEVPGNLASNGRVCYDTQNCHQSSHNPTEKKTWQLSTSGRGWNNAHGACQAQGGGAGVLGTAVTESENDRLISQLSKGLRLINPIFRKK